MRRSYRDFLYTPWPAYAQPSPLSASHTTVVHLLESMNWDKYLSPLFTLGFTLDILYLILTLTYDFLGCREILIRCLLDAPQWVQSHNLLMYRPTHQLSHPARATLSFVHSIVLNKYIMICIHYYIYIY